MQLKSLRHLKRERYRRRYRELMKTPTYRMSDKDLKEFMEIYNYFYGDFDNI